MEKFKSKIHAVRAIRDFASVSFAACLAHVNDVQANPSLYADEDRLYHARLKASQDLVDALMAFGVEQHFAEWDAKEEEANRRAALAAASGDDVSLFTIQHTRKS